MARSRSRNICSAFGLLTTAVWLAITPAHAQEKQSPGARPSGGAAERAVERLNERLAADRALLDLTGSKTKAAWEDLLVAKLYDQADETMGATLQPASDALRAQLAIPAGQALLVVSLREDSPGAQAGLKQNDVLLTLGDKPLAAAADLPKLLRAVGDGPVPLKLLRAGKPMTLLVRPVYRVTLGPVQEQKTEYYIGVNIEPLDDALRAQLALPAGRGVLITDVTTGSPAEKAGIKKHDIILELNAKPIDSADTLTRSVQAAQDKPATLKILHAGKVVTLSVTGGVRQAEANASAAALHFLAFEQVQPIANPLTTIEQKYTDSFLKTAAQNAMVFSPRVLVDNNVNETNIRRVDSSTKDQLAQRVDQLEKEVQTLQRLELIQKELKALNEAVRKLNDALKTAPSTKRE